MQTLQISSRERVQFIDITREVSQAIADAGLVEGVCYLFVPHTTSAVIINENADPSVMRDLKHKLARLLPQQDDYDHEEGNSDAHIKASLCGCAVTAPVTHGRLHLGTWQGIYYCEFDGPRQRQLHVQLIGADRAGVVQVW